MCWLLYELMCVCADCYVYVVNTIEYACCSLLNCDVGVRWDFVLYDVIVDMFVMCVVCLVVLLVLCMIYCIVVVT